MSRQSICRSLALTGIALWIGAVLWVPALAQDIPFATNTPRAVQSTTQAVSSTAVPLLPALPVDFYALRLWDENALVQVLIDEIGRLSPNDDEAELAVLLTQHELQARFPGAPRNSAQRSTLLAAMLNAPRGMVDARAAAHAAMVEALGSAFPVLTEPRVLELNGWRYEILPAQLNTLPPADAVIHSLYPANATSESALYEDFTWVSGDPIGGYRLWETRYPTAPLGDIQTLRRWIINDVNGDGLDDLVIAVEQGDLNQELLVFGWLGDQVGSLIVPGQRVLFSSLELGSAGTGQFVAKVGSVQSARWGCIADSAIIWTWTLNYFRPSASGPLVNRASMGCRLYEADNFFALPVSEALAFIEQAFAAAEPLDPTAERVQLTYALLLAFEGRPDEARQQADLLTDPELLSQRDALLNLIETETRPAALCAAVVNAAPSPETAVCDMDGLLSRLWSENPPSRTADLADQIGALGVPIADQQVIQQVGRLDRQAFRLDVPSSSWWAFAPLSADVYSAEQIPAPVPPTSNEDSPARLEPSALALSLLLSGAYPEALVALENARLQSPASPLSSAFVYLQVLAQDLSGDRLGAQLGYYQLWQADPVSVWGRLAAQHLEARG